VSDHQLLYTPISVWPSVGYYTAKQLLLCTLMVVVI